MVLRLLHLNSTQLIASTLAWVRLAKSDNATLVRRFSKRRSKLALNSIHKSCKLQNNLFKCDGLSKCHKNTYYPPPPPLTFMRCTKKISRPGMANYRMSLLKNVIAEDLFILK